MNAFFVLQQWIYALVIDKTIALLTIKELFCVFSGVVRVVVLSCKFTTLK